MTGYGQGELKIKRRKPVNPEIKRKLHSINHFNNKVRTGKENMKAEMITIIIHPAKK